MKINLKKALFKIQALICAGVMIVLTFVAFPLIGISVITLIFANVSNLYNLTKEVASLDIYGWFLIAGIIFAIACVIVGYKTGGPHLPSDKSKKDNGRSRQQKRDAIEDKLTQQMKNKHIKDKEDE